METIKIYFPRWLFPKNLGDSLVFLFVPKLLKQLNPKSKIEVISHGFINDILKYDSNIDLIRSPHENELYLNYQEYAFSNNKIENIKVIYPDWHPNTFSVWKNNHNFLVNHPSINIIILNYLLQLGLEELIFEKADFSYTTNVPILNKNISDYINIGIVPSTKLSGKKYPHPNCDGLGFRFNGLNGLDAWDRFVKKLKKENKKIKIFEFSHENFSLGDFHFKDNEDIFDLFKNIDMMDYGIMSDGGIHHAFNSRKKPVILFQACLINKVEFFKLGNALFPEHLHLPCRKQCPSYFNEIFGGENLSLKCKRECENLNPEDLADFVLKNIQLSYHY